MAQHSADWLLLCCMIKHSACRRQSADKVSSHLGAVQHADARGRGGDGGHQVRRGPGAEQAHLGGRGHKGEVWDQVWGIWFPPRSPLPPPTHLDQADLLPLRDEVVHRLLHDLAAAAHHDDLLIRVKGKISGGRTGRWVTGALALQQRQCPAHRPPNSPAAPHCPALTPPRPALLPPS